MRNAECGARLTPHVSRFTFHVSRFNASTLQRFNASRAGFTMVEIAISLAVIGFALVAIVGILPIGMGVQKENRQETVINQDATIWLNAIRNGETGLDDLTNYVMSITNSVTDYQVDAKGARQINPTRVYGYTFQNSTFDGALTTPQYPITNGLRIIGLLATPKYTPLVPISKTTMQFTSNHVVALVYSMSGPASEKFPQNNPTVQDLAFSYRLIPEVVTNQFDGTLLYGGPPAINASNSLLLAIIQRNLHDLRLTFRWPLLNQGNAGPGHQVFRSQVGGLLQPTNEPGFGGHEFCNLYLFQTRNYTNINRSP
jgi:type II secretory pathway pseudopilin PulG